MLSNLIMSHYFLVEFVEKFIILLKNESYDLFKIIFVIILLCYCVGVFSICLENKNFLLVFLAIELVNATLIVFFIFFSCFFFNINGFVYSLILLSVAAAESAIGLSLLINYHFVSKNAYLYLYDLNFLKG